jgi:two-component system CheB/CheR fusion protein
LAPSEERVPQSRAPRRDGAAGGQKRADDGALFEKGESSSPRSFFRDPQIFDALGSSVFPAMLKNRPAGMPIRFWVPGCAGGEEAFSLAIRLVEMLGEGAGAHRVRVFATDFDESVVMRARSGFYAEHAVHDVSPERLKRFFVHEAPGYRVNKRVRDLCIFARHDVTSDPPISSVDLISCRNVLGDLRTPEEARLLPIFHYALRDRGALLIGSAEANGATDELFEALDARCGLYVRRRVAERRTSPPSAERGRREEPALPSREEILEREIERSIAARYEPAGVVMNEDGQILQFRGGAAWFLEPAAGDASLALFKMVRAGLLSDVRAVVEEAKNGALRARRQGLRLTDEPEMEVTIEALTVAAQGERRFVVHFERELRRPALPLAGGAPAAEVESAEGVSQLQHELSSTKEFLQSVIRDLEATNQQLIIANEEIASTNDQLRGSNDALEISQDDLLEANRQLSVVIDELKRRHREMARVTDDLASLLSSVRIPILMVGRDLLVRHWTPSAADLFRLTPGDVNGSLEELTTHLVGIDLKERVIGVLETLEFREDDVRDEAGRWYRLTMRPYRADQDSVAGVVLSFVSIDALKRSEQQIERARRYAEGIIATVQVPLLVLDAKLRVVSANESYYESFRTSPADTEWRSISELGSRQWSNASLTELINEAVGHDKPFTGFLVEHEFPGLGRRRIVLSGRRLVRRGHEPPLVLLALEDVTERDRMEMQLRQAQKMEAVGQLAAGIAHDFNNLMTVINGCTALLLEGSALDADARDMVSDIASAGERAAALTRQLLAFSRKQMITPKKIDVNVVVAETERMLRRLIGEHIHLQTLIEPGLGRVIADPVVIQQALLNLAINSRDAMPYGGDLTIETHNVDVDQASIPLRTEGLASGPYVAITVRDTGCGMSEEAVRRIFEPFFTTKEVGKGSGLGLSSVYGSIKQSGGSIDVDSYPGRGTTFTIYLPRLTGTTHSEPPKADVKTLPSGQETVLLVEDAHDVRKLTSRMLQMAGYRVLEADGATAALEISKQHQGSIHLLVSDVVMPQTGGPKLAELLLPLRREMKVLFISGYAEKPSGSGPPSAHPLLQKPYTPTTFLQKVRELLDGR